MATDWLKLQTEYILTQISLRGLADKHCVSRSALEKTAAREGWAAMKRARLLMRAEESGRNNDTGDQPEADGQTAIAPQTILAPEPGEADQPAQRTVSDTGGLHRTADRNRTFPTGDKSRKRGLATSPMPELRQCELAASTEPAAPPMAGGCVPDAKKPAASTSHSDRIARLMAIGDRLTEQLARATVELDKQVLRQRRKTREMVYEGADARGKPVEETVQENIELEIVDATVNCAGLQKLSATLKNLREAAQANAGDEQSVGMVAELMRKLDDEAGREDA